MPIKRSLCQNVQVQSERSSTGGKLDARSAHGEQPRRSVLLLGPLVEVEVVLRQQRKDRFLRLLGSVEANVEYDALQIELLHRLVYHILLPDVGSVQVLVAGADEQRVELVRVTEYFGRDQMRALFAAGERVHVLVLNFIVRRNREVEQLWGRRRERQKGAIWKGSQYD